MLNAPDISPGLRNKINKALTAAIAAVGGPPAGPINGPPLYTLAQILDRCKREIERTTDGSAISYALHGAMNHGPPKPPEPLLSQLIELRDKVLEETGERAELGRQARLALQQASVLRVRSAPLTRAIHEHLVTVVNYAYAACGREQLINRYSADRDKWKFLLISLSSGAEEQATLALMDMALYLRTVDEALGDGIAYMFGTDFPPAVFGFFQKTDESAVPMSLRDCANKIIHAESYRWELSIDEPAVICVASQKQQQQFKWINAHIHIPLFVAGCGYIASA